MFGRMEAAKQELYIEDYSISQTSLEQVFLTLTKFQRETTMYRPTAMPVETKVDVDTGPRRPSMFYRPSTHVRASRYNPS